MLNLAPTTAFLLPATTYTGVRISLSADQIHKMRTGVILCGRMRHKLRTQSYVTKNRNTGLTLRPPLTETKKVQDRTMASTQTNIATTPTPSPGPTPGTSSATGSLLVSLVPLTPE